MLQKFSGSRSIAPVHLGISKAERRAFCLLGYVFLISFCLKCTKIDKLILRKNH